jgi:hypothetical protein
MAEADSKNSPASILITTDYFDYLPNVIISYSVIFRIRITKIVRFTGCY